MQDDFTATQLKFQEQLAYHRKYAHPATPINLLVAPACGAKSIMDVDFADIPDPKLEELRRSIAWKLRR